MEITNYKFKAEPACDFILNALSEEEEKAVEDICTILNGRTLDKVETILQKVRRQYSQAVFCNDKQKTECVGDTLRKAVKRLGERRLPYD